MTDNEIKCDTVINDLYAILNALNSGFAADTIEAAIKLIRLQRAEIEKWQSGYMTQKQEIANLEIEFKAMRGAANSLKAENAILNVRYADACECIKQLTGDIEAMLGHMLVCDYIITKRKDNLTAPSASAFDTTREHLVTETNIDDIIASMEKEPNFIKEVTKNIIAATEDLNLTTDQIEYLLNKLVVGENNDES